MNLRHFFDKSQALRGEAQELINALSIFKNNLVDTSQVLRNDVQSLGNKSLLIRNEIDKLKNEAETHKKNKVAHQVNLTAKIRIYYFKNINEITVIMNELHDEPHFLN